NVVPERGFYISNSVCISNFVDLRPPQQDRWMADGTKDSSVRPRWSGQQSIPCLCVAICRISHLGWRLLVWWLPFIGGHAFEDWPGGFGVLVAGGCGDGEVFWSCLMSPTGIFFVLVAAGAESGAIVPVGGATVAVWGGMVGVFNTCIAVWSPTGVVSQGDHLSQVDWEVSCLGVNGHQSTIPRSSKEPAVENCS